MVVWGSSEVDIDRPDARYDENDQEVRENTRLLMQEMRVDVEEDGEVGLYWRKLYKGLSD
jgi:hypothetical protein